MVESTESTGFRLGQRLHVGRPLCVVNIVNHQVRAHDVGIHILIEVIIRQDGAVSLLVESIVDTVERQVLIAEDVRLFDKRVVGEVPEGRRVIASHGIRNQFIILTGGIDGYGPFGCDVDIIVTGSEDK